jgi:hypothetical protein
MSAFSWSGQHHASLPLGSASSSELVIAVCGLCAPNGVCTAHIDRVLMICVLICFALEGYTDLVVQDPSFQVRSHIN